MQTLKIGLMDEEQEFVEMLASYLDRLGKGRWKLMSFTRTDALQEHLAKHTLHILATTNRGLIESISKSNRDLQCLWLTEDVGKTDISSVCRYQGAKVIGGAVRKIADSVCLGIAVTKPMVAIYSPVGRCGKTTYGLSVIKREDCGRWLYVGMEDYGSFSSEYGEDFWFYMKERGEDKLLSIMEQSEGAIASPYCVMDTKRITKEDMEWLKTVIWKSNYKGALFDIGTGTLPDLELLFTFDHILVPYIQEKHAIEKRDHFMQLIKQLNFGDFEESIHMMDMRNIDKEIDNIFGGGY